MTIREALPADAETLAGLAAELGYEVSAGAMRRRLEAVEGRDRELVLLAEEGPAILGFVHAQARRDLLAGARAEIVALAVTAGARRGGVGRRLVEGASRWAGERGLRRVRVRTNTRRRGAARFYQRLGFLETKRQRVLERVVEGVASPLPAGR